MRVLIVEDSEIMRRELRRLLSMLPATSVVFETGAQQEATDWLARNPAGWDLALVDLFLENGNGFGVLKACEARSPGQKVVMMTNYVNDIVRGSAQAAGADAFFEKTSELDQLGAFCKQLSPGLDAQAANQTLLRALHGVLR